MEWWTLGGVSGLDPLQPSFCLFKTQPISLPGVVGGERVNTQIKTLSSVSLQRERLSPPAQVRGAAMFGLARGLRDLASALRSVQDRLNLPRLGD